MSIPRIRSSSSILFRPLDTLFAQWLPVDVPIQTLFSASVVYCFWLPRLRLLLSPFGHCFPASWWECLATLVHPFPRISCSELLPPTYPVLLLCSHPGSFISSSPWLLLSVLPLTKALSPWRDPLGDFAGGLFTFSACWNVCSSEEHLFCPYKCCCSDSYTELTEGSWLLSLHFSLGDFFFFFLWKISWRNIASKSVPFWYLRNVHKDDDVVQRVNSVNKSILTSA